MVGSTYVPEGFDMENGLSMPPKHALYQAGAAKLTQSCEAQLTNKTHFYCEKLNSYEHLQIL